MLGCQIQREEGKPQGAAQGSHWRTLTGVMGYADPRTSVPGNLIAMTFFTWTKAPLQKEGTVCVKGQVTHNM